MRPFRPFCGTVSNAQLLTLPATIRISANGGRTIQLSFGPPASSSATDVAASSDSRPATAQPPEPAPTTTKSYVSVTNVPPVTHSCRVGKAKRAHRGRDGGHGACAPLPTLRICDWLRHEPQHLLQPRDLAAIGRVEIGHAVEDRAIEHRLELAQRVETPFAVIGAGTGGADAAHRLVDLREVKQAVVDG